MNDRMKTKGLPVAEMDKQIGHMQVYKEMYKSPLMAFLITLIEPLPVGVVVLIISGFLVRMKKNTVSA